MRLLVVEDDPDLNRQLVAALQDAGYVVDSAKDGDQLPVQIGIVLDDKQPHVKIPETRCLGLKAESSRCRQ